MRVVHIFVAPSEGAPMEERELVLAVEERGLENDRYPGEGWWSDKKGRTSVGDRQVTLFDLGDLTEANEELDIPFEPGETRRNIAVTRDGDGDIKLEDLVGARFRVGGVLVEGASICKPCGRPGELVGKEGFARAFRGARGGLRARILSTARITREVSVVLAPN